MDRALVNYKLLAPKEYLSGSYFNLVFDKEPGLIRQPLVIRISNQNVTVVSKDIRFRVDPNIPVYVLRIIIELMGSDGKLVSRHSNAIIIDSKERKIVKFEPLAGVDTSKINQVLLSVLRPSFRGYQFIESSAHPQHIDSPIGLCVAYTIKFVYFCLLKEPIVFEGDYDIHQFSLVIQDLYGMIEDDDIEFGGGFGAGALLGGLALGTLIAAPLIASAAYQPRYVYI